MSIRVPVTALRFKDVITAGLDPYTLMSLVPRLRKTSQDHKPVLVSQPCPTCATRIALDGRHRWIASVIAGRHDVLADEQEWP